MDAQPPSRPKSLFRLFLRMGGWVSLIFVGMFVLLTWVSSLSEARAIAMEERGQSATASLVSTRFSRSDDSTTYYMTVQFEFDQRTITTETTISAYFYNRAEKGMPVEVWFLPESPRKIDLHKESAQQSALFVRWAALVNGVLALAAFWFPAQWAVAAVRARRYGQRRTAKITDLHRTRVKVNNRSRYRLIWRDETGQEGRSLMAAESAFGDFSTGRQITVYAGIKRTWWEGDLFQ